MSNLSRKKAFLVSYLSLAVDMISSFLFTPFLVEYLGQSEYGLYSLVGTITSYLLLLDLGVGNAVIRYMSKYRFHNDIKNQKNFLGLITLFYGIIGIIVIILGIFLQKMLPIIFQNGLTIEEINKLQIMFGITMTNAAFTLMISGFDKVIIAFEHFSFSKGINIVKTILRVSISLIALKNGRDAVFLVLINFLITLVFGFVSIMYVLLKIKVTPNFRGFEFGYIKEVLGFSSLVLLQMIATQINTMADKILLGAMASSTFVGVYALGSQIAQYYQSIAGATNGVLMPGVVNLIEKKASPKKLLDEMVNIGRFKLSYLGIIWVVFLLYGQLFINLWIGTENSYNIYLVTAIFMFPMLIFQIQSVGNNILWAKNKFKLQAYLQISISILSIGLIYILIQWNPIIGAAMGSAFSMFVCDIVVMNIMLNKILSISMKDYYYQVFDKIGLSLVVSFLVGIFIGKLSFAGWSGLITKCSLTVICYFILMNIYGLNESEKRTIEKLFKKVRL